MKWLSLLSLNFRLAEHVVIDNNSNTSLEQIFSLAVNDYEKNTPSSRLDPKLSYMITEMFPQIKKSKVFCQKTGKKSQSFRCSVESSTCNIAVVEFNNLEKWKPHDWFVLNKLDDKIVFGHFFMETFNDNKTVMELSLSKAGQISISIADVHINLSEYYIPTKIQYTARSLPAIFRCTKLIKHCHGYEIKTNDDLKFSTSFSCSKEVCKVGTNSMNVIRSVSCTHFLPLRSSICRKCSNFIQNRKQTLQKHENKENICINSKVSKEEIKQFIKSIAPNLHENQLTLILSQIVASNTKSKTSVRWDKDVICMALVLFNRNPAAYRDMTLNKWLHLPSEQMLKIYKNAVRQGPGIIPEMMLWMANEGKRQIKLDEGYYGGLILDEMAIQEDLQLVNTKECSALFGLSDSGNDVQMMTALNEGKLQSHIANHVQQYVFNGLTGFRWPFANFPNTQASPSEIFVTSWMCIDELYRWGFRPIYCCMDGSANNRAFLKMHFPDGNSLCTNMIAKCFKYPGRKIVLFMDPCHLLKKIRNSILSSGFLESHQRLLTINESKMWIDAYNWDRTTNSFHIHHKLSEEHIFPSNAQKMRNKLAFDVLDSEMLNLMQQYTSSLNAACQEEMKGVLQFLQHTSFLVSFFKDFRPVKDINDERLRLFSEAYNWFKSWEKSNVGSTDDEHKRYKTLMTMETREDLDFLYLGFMSLTHIMITELKSELTPARINSDIVENIFCQERSLYHGANTNPNYNEYRTGINSIILGQATTSRKSNAGGVKAEPFALGPPPKKMHFLI
ncbi:unnamed protein product [Mytilus edulis]|uniref:Transposable element P transposase-like RNase H domain-containing protein n=1 Tax=Mytilus edulis TaxID=6550 RepID=A0A8S3RQR1_MYTED|nr:unnamed protein product [Mytilus edulis]